MMVLLSDFPLEVGEWTERVLRADDYHKKDKEKMKDVARPKAAQVPFCCRPKSATFVFARHGGYIAGLNTILVGWH